MSFRNLLQKFGAWTTVLKWHEPWMYRVRLKGDWLARFAVAFAVGALPTTLLLVLFAINVRPPNPLFAFIGMAIFGGLALMFLVNGRATAGGRVRICEEGIIRRRMYAGLSSQWVEDWSWPYSQITQCAVIPGISLDKSFSVLMFTDGSDVEFIGIPERIDLEQIRQLLAAKGVVVRHDVGLPPQFLRPMGLPIPFLGSAFSLLLILAGFAFYTFKTADKREEIAVADRDWNGDPAPVGEADAVARPAAPALNQTAPAEAPPPAGLEPPESGAQVDSSIAGSTTGPSAPLSAVEAESQTSNPSPPAETIPSPVPVPASSEPVDSAPLGMQKTDLIGGAGGATFEVIPPGHEPVVGFRYRLGNWGGKSAVAQLDPITLRDVTGSMEGLVIGHADFVVGGIQVDADELVRAVRIVFVSRSADGTLDKTSFYFSEWIGEPTEGAVKTLGKGNVPVLGVYGRRGLVLDAIGLVLAQP